MPFPEQRALMEELVAEHQDLKDQPLLLAVYYASEVYPNDECLFEVAENFGFNVVDPDKALMQIALGRSENLPLPSGTRLVLMLTNPPEGITATQEDWQEMQDVKQAIRSGAYEVLFRDASNNEAQIILEGLEARAAAA